MVWKRLFGKAEPPAEPAPLPPQPDASGIVRRQRPAADPAMQQRLDTLRRRRDMAAYDLERAEAARRPENHWQERISLIDTSLATIEADLQALDAIPPITPFPLPQTPLADVAVSLEEPVSVDLSIGPEHFHWEEEIDWDQRGGPVVRGQLRQHSGDVSKILPADVPSDRRDDLLRHLADSVNVLAVDLRDRTLEGEPIPAQITLADLARPCPTCGDWMDWLGHCATCAHRAWQRQNLRQEAARLTREREELEEDRHKWSERLTVARKRFADIEAELAAIETG
jgi:FtsZ-binding cell division protein ZapB